VISTFDHWQYVGSWVGRLYYSLFYLLLHFYIYIYWCQKSIEHRELSIGMGCWAIAIGSDKLPWPSGRVKVQGKSAVAVGRDQGSWPKIN